MFTPPCLKRKTAKPDSAMCCGKWLQKMTPLEAPWLLGCAVMTVIRLLQVIGLLRFCILDREGAAHRWYRVWQLAQGNKITGEIRPRLKLHF